MARQTLSQLLEKMSTGSPVALARLMTLVERDGREVGPILEAIAPQLGHAFTIGVTGPPGAGKSSLVDSLIGATFQAQYQCDLCNKMTERSTHCNGKETIYSHGLKWLSNDIVNFICAFSGGVFVLIGLQFI